MLKFFEVKKMLVLFRYRNPNEFFSFSFASIFLLRLQTEAQRLWWRRSRNTSRKAPQSTQTVGAHTRLPNWRRLDLNTSRSITSTTLWTRRQERIPRRLNACGDQLSGETRGTARHHLESYLAEFMWRKLLKGDDVFESLLEAIKDFWPPESQL